MSLLVLAVVALLQTSPIDPVKASGYFNEYKLLAAKEDGKTWGKQLHAPLLFVDPKTRAIVANQNDPELSLKEDRGVFTGTLPPNKLIANALVDWGKTQWVMVMWPVSENYSERMSVLIHESFHRIQPDLGFVRQGDTCDHLNTLEGRYWMQLEWRALAWALRTGNSRCVQDALLFRQERYRLFPNAKVAEARIERLEGTAAYTGTVVAFPLSEAFTYSARRLDDAVSKTENLPRLFAYLTGPAYGLLLDKAGAKWKEKAATIEDYCAELSNAMKLKPGPDLQKATERYDSKALMKAEQGRAAKIQAQIDDFKKLLVDGPVLEAPMTSWRASTNALKMTPIGEKRVVHTYLVANTDWGQLSVDTSAALVDENTRTIYVPMPFTVSGSDLVGNGWKIALKPGWKTVSGARAGDMKLVSSTQPRSFRTARAAQLRSRP